MMEDLSIPALPLPADGLINKGYENGGEFLKILQSFMDLAIINGDVGNLLLIQISFAIALSVALIIPKMSEPT